MLQFKKKVAIKIMILKVVYGHLQFLKMELIN